MGIQSLVSAEEIAFALKGRWTVGGWTACCPAHEDRSPSLSISQRDGTVLVYCHAGCPQEYVIAALSEQGLWPTGPRETNAWQPTVNFTKSIPKHDGGRRQGSTLEHAEAIWSSASSARHTLAEKYLQSRKIVVPVPDSIRFCASLRHPEGQSWPVMVARIVDGASGENMGIHRTFLNHDGSGKAPVQPAKMMLGSSSGGVVQLAQPADFLMIGEGIETCLAAMQMYRAPAWAALSTSGIKSLVLPAHIRSIIILADGDPPGRSAAIIAAHRFMADGRTVHVFAPPGVKDFNDALRSAACVSATRDFNHQTLQEANRHDH
jgi:putative DNA primase/helicase